MRKSVFILNLFVIFLAFSFLFLYLYWLIFPLKVITYDEPMKVLTPIVEQGGLLEYEVYVCKYVDLPSITTTSFVGSVVLSKGTFPTNTQTGCNTQKLSSEVPEFLPEGKYKYRILLVYELNPIRTKTFVILSEEFNVVSKKDNNK